MATLPCADPLPPVGYSQALLPTQSLPAWHGTSGRAGAMSPGLGRTLGGEGAASRGVGLVGMGGRGQDQVCDQGEVFTQRGWKLEGTGMWEMKLR